MEVYTLKDIAEELGVTYEAVRQQVIRYSDDLKGHITKQGKKQFVDEWGLDFLKTKRREYHVIVEEDKETVNALKAEIEALKASLLQAQNELLASKDRVIALQEEVREGLEAKASYHLLLEEKTKAEEKIEEMTEQVAVIRSENDAIKEEKESLRAEAERQQEQIFSLKAESESQRATIDSLTQERDAAIEESQSYHKSWFGFYRKG